MSRTADELWSVVRVTPEVDPNRLNETAGKLRADPRLSKAASDNWFILFGEPLPG